MDSARPRKMPGCIEQIGLGDLWMIAHYGDIGIINIIRQRLKDIELQRWLSEINNLPVIQNDRQLQM